MKKHFILILLIILVTTTLIACGGGDETGYKDGTYSGEAKGFNGQVKVSVEVKGGKIADVKVTEHEETDGISDPAIDEIPSKIVEKNSADVDVVSGATSTSDAIKAAVVNALEGAK